ncbi:MAG: MBL fold metallo-hydrolase [Proteobacteria bacterium]|nr:MBL fold metallo-hydrolase [Pseudomonadota bacterium]MBU1388104.1 MBL fold metallo-hydrolase [Pseudomonadota bacterium]MBU1542168.1 MBL fold metallo-hydrolase [Pseudomonadota bacterium]MBU2481676.1 MBL fold metallo-hydrolase [Pseudomonadota bacterium]
MIIQNTGKAGDKMYVVGSSATPVYLLDGPKPILFDAGLTAFTLQYEAGIKEILKTREPSYLFLTHSHFDHIGAASYFKKLWPELKIAGSEKCGEILAKPNAVKLMTDLNYEAARGIKEMCLGPVYESPFEPFELDVIVQPGQTMDISSGVSVSVINTPGHTWDFMAYYIPEQKILVASEAVATYESGGYLQPEFLVDFDAYLDSIQTIEKLDTDILCGGHHAVFTGADAAKHIRRSFNAANHYLSMAQKFLIQEKGDIDRAVAQIKAEEWDPRPWPKQPESAYLLNTWQRVNTISRRMNKPHE